MHFPNYNPKLRSIALRLLLCVYLCLPLAVGASTVASRAPASDTQIQQTIQAKLSKSKIGKDGIRFRVAHGVVTWEGATNVMQHKGAATRMAKAAGAMQVVNNIQVSAAAKAKAEKNLKKATVIEQ